MNTNKPILCLVAVFFSAAMAQTKNNGASRASGKIINFTKEQLPDKIKGGWAGQTIGVTFGGPNEFRFNDTFIQDYQPLLWYNGHLKEAMLYIPGLYDDLYKDNGKHTEQIKVLNSGKDYELNPLEYIIYKNATSGKLQLFIS